MQSGVLTKDNFDALMRSWAQRRHNGEVEIHIGERIVRIVFYQGKIVECSEDGIRPAHEIRALLGREVPEGASDEETYADAWQSFESAGGLTSEQMRASIRKRVLDKLHTLQFGPGAFYTLRLEMPFFERDWAPQVSVGGLLLDLVDAADILQKWPAVSPEGTKFSIAPAAGDGSGAAPASADERLIAEKLAAPATLSELEAATLIPLVHLERALLVLMERGVVAATVPEPEPEQPPPPPVPEVAPVEAPTPEPSPAVVAKVETPVHAAAPVSTPETPPVAAPAPAPSAEPSKAPKPVKIAPAAVPKSASKPAPSPQSEQPLRIIWPQTDADRLFASIAVVVLGAIAGIGAWLDFATW